MCDALKTAILDVLALVPSCRTALSTLSPHFDAQQRRQSFQLSGKLDTGKIFHDQDLEELERLLAPLQREIADGERTEIISDEGHVAGGWIQTILIPEAQDLQKTCAPLVELRDALRKVRTLRRTERVYAALSTVGG